MKTKLSSKSRLNSTRDNHFSIFSKDEALKAIKIKKILLPIDFSAAGKPALRYAKAFAQLTKASICLVHVMERIYSPDEFTYIQIDITKTEGQVSREIGALQMGMFQEIKTDFSIRQGLPFQEIVDAAEEKNADLIIMATHGYTGFRRILIGSTAERVIRYATCPVLVVRSKQSRSRAKAR